MEFREQSFQNEIKDLCEDHAAEIEGLQEKIAELEGQVRTANNRKSHVEKIAQKKLVDKIAEIDLQSSELDVAYSDNNEKEARLKEIDERLRVKEERIHFLESFTEYHSRLYSELKDQQLSDRLWVIEPLRQEVARLTSLNLEYQQLHANQASLLSAFQDQIQNQPDYAELQAAFAEACKERDIFKADAEQIRKLFEQTLGELNEARNMIVSQNVRLWNYSCKHEDDPDRHAGAGDLLEKTRERCRDLEKKANECYSLWKDDTRLHQNEKVLLKAEIEERQNKINILEGMGILCGQEVSRLTAIFEQHVNVNLTGLGNIHGTLQAMYEASQETVRELKTKNGQLQSQVDVSEKDNHQHKVALRLCEQMLDDKDAEIRDINEAKAEAERMVDDLNSKYEMRELAVKEKLTDKDQQLEWTKKQFEDLEAHVESLMQSGFGVESAETIERHQEEIFNLQQYIANLQTENKEFHQRQLEQNQKDMLDGICAAQNEVHMKAHQDNWENAQEEILKLKHYITLIDKGCDPEKFDIAQDYSKLRNEYAELEKKYTDLLEETIQTMHKCAATEEEKATEASRKIAVLGQLVENLCAQLAEAWFGPEQDVDDGDQDGLERQQTLVKTLTSVRDMVATPTGDEHVPVEDEEGGKSGEAAIEDNQHVGDGQGSEIFTNEPELDAQGLNVPPFTLPDPWDYITNSGPSRSVLDSTHRNFEQTDGWANFIKRTSTDSAAQPGRTFGVDYDLTSSTTGSVESQNGSIQVDDGDDDLYESSVRGDQPVQITETVQPDDDDLSATPDDAIQPIDGFDEQASYEANVLSKLALDVEAEILSPGAKALIDSKSAV